MSDLVLALDYGGTKLSAAIASEGAGPTVSGDGWLALERVQKPAGADGAFDRATMLQLANKLLAGRTPKAVGVSFGGPVDFPNGEVRLSHHVPGWEGQPLAAQLQEALGAPTTVDNDANAGALGEHAYGAGRGQESLLYITVSTGVGGGWILGGRVWRGADGMAGEFGHVKVDPFGPECVCGGRGCVEALASGPALARAAAVRLAADPSAGTVLRQVAGQDEVTAVHLGAAAVAGDTVAAEALATGARAIGIAIGSAANLVNPGRFVVGGGVVKAGEAFWATLIDAASEHAMPEVNVEVVRARLGDDAPLWGAVKLAEGTVVRRSVA
ncbi:MAG TPA: ROK family protein [Trueperaceae bacterium]|nr:ROK family protein [Trueperaceae bacterium]